MKPKDLEISRSDTGNTQTICECDERLQCIIDLSCDYYWEQDEHGRFTVVGHRHIGQPENCPSPLLGKTQMELGGMPVDTDWDEHQSLVKDKQAFRDFVIRRFDTGGQEQYMSLSGEPMFDAKGRFRGYRGIARDVTDRQRAERWRKLERRVNAILMEAEHTSEAVAEAIRAVCESEGWEAGQYWRLDEHDDVMRFNAGWSVESEVIKEVTTKARRIAFRRAVGLVGAVWETGEPLWVPDLHTEEHLLRKDIVGRTGWRSALLFPVFVKALLIGVLDFNAPWIPEPDQRLMQVLRVLALQIGNFHRRRAALERLRDSEERYASTVELAAIGISHVGADGRFVSVNRQFCEMLGYSKEELLASTVKDISHPADADITDKDRARLHAGQIDSMKAEKRYLRKDGKTIWVRITIAVKRDEAGTPLYDISIVEDITDRKRAEEQVEYLATHDAMTGLPNRAMFSELLRHTIESNRRHRHEFAILFIDLDRFKIVNDSLGHEAGDVLLKEMASRLKRCLRASDIVARLGGDEFVVLLVGLDRSRAGAAVAARKILSTVLQPVEIMGHECRVTASIGITRFPHDADNAQSLMRNADIAMYLAKEEGKNNFQFFSKEISPMSVRRLALEAHLRRALENDEFTVHYQPKVDLKTGTIKGAEALLRWWNPHLGTVSPVQFIALAEDTGLIVPIGKWVLETACQQNVEWQRRGLPSIVMAVNLSSRQFKDGDLLTDIADVLEQTGMAPELLELEITESMIMNNVDEAVEKIAAIKQLGVRLAIDDFGTGYSSLSQLKRFPIDTLKVDRSFIRDIPASAEDKAITEAIISMGKTLGVTVVAEGVETAAQHAFLRGHACDEMQGFYFSKPCHHDGLAELLGNEQASKRVIGHKTPNSKLISSPRVPRMPSSTAMRKSTARR